MKMFFVIFSFVIALSLGCEVRPTTSQANDQTSLTPSPSPVQTPPDGSEKPPCELTMDQAPVINGLRLRMPVEQVLALFPGSKEDAEVKPVLAAPPNKFGNTSFVIRPEKFESKENFQGIGQITFRFLDGRISNYTAGYNGPKWPHVDEFVKKFVEGTTLPPVDNWEVYVGLDTQLKTLRCKDFEIKVFAGGEGGNLNYVEMRDLAADQELKDRRAKARQAATPDKQ